MERVTGLEPVSPTWKAGAQPLDHTRLHILIIIPLKLKMVRAEGIEPSTIGLSDQSSTTEIHPFKMVGLGRLERPTYELKVRCSTC